MTFVDVLRTLLEIVMVVLLVWCVFNEDRLVAFERRCLCLLRRRRLRVVKANKLRSSY